MSARDVAAPRRLEGTARDFAWLYAPPPQRAALGALLDIEREIGAAFRPGLEHTVAHVRLAWWREECERCAAGRAVHPATRALVGAVGHPVAIVGLVEAAEWDLAGATFETRAELTGYCERWATATTQVLAQSITGDAAAGRAFGRSLGIALKEIELMLALAEDARRGRLRLPLAELHSAGVEPMALAAAPWSPALCRLIASRHRAARSALAETIAELPAALRPALRGLLVWAALAHRASRRAERALPAPWRPRAGSRVADAWLAWRSARRADRQPSEFELESLA